MRIAFVSTYPPIECGIGTYTQYLSDALKKRQNEVFVISQVGAQGEKVFAVYSPESFELSTQIFNVAKKITPDLLHIQHEFGLYGYSHGVQVVDLILQAKLIGLPVITTLHTVHEKLDFRDEIILGPIVYESDAVIVHEEFQKEILTARFGHAERIHVIPHGVRELDLVPNAAEKIGIAPDKKVILMCGYFRPTKRFDLGVKWFPQIAEKVPEAMLLIAGKARNVEFRSSQVELFKQINNSPVSDRIEVLRGQFPQHTFDTIVSSASVVLMPYEVGAQSGVMAQCFAFRKPVVVSTLPAFKIAMEASGGGVVCKSEKEFVEKTVHLLNDPQKGKVLEKNIDHYVSRKVGWSLVADQHIKLYHSAITTPYGRARYVYVDP